MSLIPFRSHPDAPRILHPATLRFLTSLPALHFSTRTRECSGHIDHDILQEISRATSPLIPEVEKTIADLNFDDTMDHSQNTYNTDAGHALGEAFNTCDHTINYLDDNRQLQMGHYNHKSGSNGSSRDSKAPTLTPASMLSRNRVTCAFTTAKGGKLSVSVQGRARANKIFAESSEERTWNESSKFSNRTKSDCSGGNTSCEYNGHFDEQLSQISEARRVDLIADNEGDDLERNPLATISAVDVDVKVNRSSERRVDTENVQDTKLPKSSVLIRDAPLLLANDKFALESSVRSGKENIAFTFTNDVVSTCIQQCSTAASYHSSYRRDDCPIKVQMQASEPLQADYSMHCKNLQAIGLSLPVSYSSFQITSNNDETLSSSRTEQVKSGFSSARGKPLQISAEARLKATKLLSGKNNDSSRVQASENLEGASTSDNNYSKAVDLPSAIVTNMSNQQVGGSSKFTSARGRKITVSAEAIKKANALFNDISGTPSDEVSTIPRAPATCDVPTIANANANNHKSPAVLMADCSQGTTLDAAKFDSVNNTAGSSAFQTAKGKKVEVSVEARERANQLFKELDVPIHGQELRAPLPKYGALDILTNNSLPVEGTDMSHQGISKFKSASGKKVTVSLEAMSAASELIKDISGNAFLEPKVNINTGVLTSSNTLGDPIAFAQTKVETAVTTATPLNITKDKYSQVQSPDNLHTEALPQPESHSAVVLKSAIKRTQVHQPGSAKKAIRFADHPNGQGELNKVSHVADVSATNISFNPKTALSSNHTAVRYLISMPDIRRHSLMTEAAIYLNFKYKHSQLAAVEARSRMEFLRKINSHTCLQLCSIDINEACVDAIGNEDNGTALATEVLKRLARTVNSSSVCWVAKQLRMIIWTLAAVERRYPFKNIGRLLTTENILAAVARRHDIYYRIHVTNLFPVPVRQKPHKSAIQYFGQVGAMPPLQRFVDICQFEWPLVVVCALSKAADGYEAMEVSDGWSWVSCLVDDGVRKLISSRRIKDGTKIIIFRASLKLDGPSTSMLLSLNCVRKARDSAKLGRCPPQYLSAGLTIRSLTVDGGAVYAVKGTVLMVTEVCNKCRMGSDDRDSSKRCDSNMAVVDTFYLPGDLLNTLTALVDREKETLISRLDGHEEMQLPSLLDDLCCEDWIVTAMKTLESGGGISQYSDSEILAIQKTKSKLANISASTRDRLAKEVTADINLNVSASIDVLISCCRSQSLAWLRFPVPTAHDNGEMGPQTSPREILHVGSEVLVTNLKPAKSAGTTINLATTQNTVIYPKETKSSTEVQQLCMKQSLIAQTPLRTIMNNMFASKQPTSNNIAIVPMGAISVSQEVSFYGEIVDWHIVPGGDPSTHQRTNIPSAAKCSFEVRAVEIHLIDSTRVSMLLTVTWPLALFYNYRISWLQCGQKVVVTLASATSADADYEIIRAHWTERTFVAEVPTESDLLDANVTSKISGKRRRRSTMTAAKAQALKLHETADQFYNNANADGPHKIDGVAFKILLEERLRAQALRSNMQFFQLTSDLGGTQLIEHCRRKYIRSAMVVTLSADPSACISGPHVCVATVSVHNDSSDRDADTSLSMELHSSLIPPSWSINYDDLLNSTVRHIGKQCDVAFAAIHRDSPPCDALKIIYLVEVV